MKYFIYSVIAIVAAAVVTGVLIVGSPQNKRTQRFDERRVNDLSTIQYQIIDYWQRKNALPPNLEAMRNDLQGNTVPVDPETKALYEYEETGDLSFRLCANFSVPSRADGRTPDRSTAMPVPVKGGAPDIWDHGEGRVCFDRTIDPDFYKPFPR